MVAAWDAVEGMKVTLLPEPIQPFLVQHDDPNVSEIFDINLLDFHRDKHKYLVHVFEYLLDFDGTFDLEHVTLLMSENKYDPLPHPLGFKNPQFDGGATMSLVIRDKGSGKQDI